MRDSMFYGMDNEARNDVVNSRESNPQKRSAFPYGISTIMTMNEGYLYPVDCFFTMPGDSIDIDFAAYLENINAFADRQYSGMKLCFHAYYNKCEHEWKGWKSYSTRGHRGNITLGLPYVLPSAGYRMVINGKAMRVMVPSSSPEVEGDYTEVSFDVQHSLASYLVNYARYHLPNQPFPSTYYTAPSSVLLNTHDCGDNTQTDRTFRLLHETYNDLTGNIGTNVKFNAIPFAMYQRIYRDYYLNQNLVKDNPLWLPDDDDDFVLPYIGGPQVSMTPTPSGYVQPFSLVPNNFTELLPSNVASYDATKDYADGPILTAMRVRQWSGDPFTTSVPFLERNGQTALFSTLNRTLLFTPGGNFQTIPDSSIIQNVKDLSPSSVSENVVTAGRLDTSQYGYGNLPVYSATTTNPGQFGVLLNLNALRELNAATLWSTRNAQAKGDYNSLIRAHYGINPNSEDRMSRYLGGTVMNFQFNDVVSQSETSTQPLGTKTTNSSASGRSSISHFECHDFGYIMIIASLVPTTFYTQGLRPEFDADLSANELPWPEYANLQKENVLKKRLYYFGYGAEDNKLIGFNERFLNYKYRSNVLKGNMLDWKDKKFKSMTFARYFDPTDMQNLNSIDNEFVSLSPYNVRGDMYSVPNQPHYILQFGDSVRLVRALPFASKEMNLTNIL